MRTVVIANPKGGCGKTTTAVNLAAALAQKGKRVLIVDLDPQAHATLGLGHHPNTLDKTAYPSLANKQIAIFRVIVGTYIKGLNLAPSNILLANAELELSTVFRKEFVLAQQLKVVSDEYDICVIDSPPSLGLLTLNALVASTDIIVPVQAHYYALESLKQLLETVNITRKHFQPCDVKVLGLLLTFVESWTPLSQQVEQQMRDFFGDLVFNTVIHRTISLAEAPSAGESILTYAPESIGATDYRALTEEVSAAEREREVSAVFDAGRIPGQDTVRQPSGPPTPRGTAYVRPILHAPGPQIPPIQKPQPRSRSLPKATRLIESKFASTIKTFKQTLQYVFHPRVMKRRFGFFLVLAILLAIALVMILVSAVNNPPVVDGEGTTTQEDTPVPITLMGSDPDGDPLTYNVVTGPFHGSLSGTSPNLTYTPDTNFNGSDSFTFQVNDGMVDSDPATVSIIVKAVNDGPIPNPQSVTTKVNKPVSITLTGSDVDGDLLMFSTCTEPRHGMLTLDSNFNTNGKFIYTPEPRFTGPDSFAFKLTDGRVDSAPATVSINVIPNYPPVVDTSLVTTAEDAFVAVTLVGRDPDGDPLTYSVVTGPAHGSLSGTGPNLTYTPNTNFNGSDSFTFKVNDGAADSALTTVTIMVTPVNDPPTADDDRAMTQEDTPVTIDVLANDTDVDNDQLRVSAVTQGTNGSVHINTDSTLTYTPSANFYGTDAFTYTTGDSKGGNHTATVNVTVNAVNDAPAIISTPITTAAERELYTYDVNATDPDVGDTLTCSLANKPAGMTIHPATGLIQWRPTNAQVGTNDVVVKVADSNNIPASDTQSFTITVNPAPPRITTLTIVNGYDEKTKKTLSADGKSDIVQASDNNRLETVFGSYISYDFSDVSIPAGATITSVVIYVEHFEEEQFPAGKLQWNVGTAWPRNPVVWVSINAPVCEGERNEAIDAWDITSFVDTLEKVNSLQLQIKNNDSVAKRKTLVDYIYAVVEWNWLAPGELVQPELVSIR